jgi:two-component system copper resistance phosphate regulon response regulator CusR
MLIGRRSGVGGVPVRALVVEDDRRISRFIEKGLREASYVVELADNGETGMRLALGGGFDAIVLDLMLPARDGFSVLRSIRQAGVATPVICLTARSPDTPARSGPDR